MSNEAKFKPYDHVIWDNDTTPSVCILGESKGGVFYDIQFHERITLDQLRGARHATGKEILEFYRSEGAEV